MMTCAVRLTAALAIVKVRGTSSACRHFGTAWAGREAVFAQAHELNVIPKETNTTALALMSNLTYI